MAVSDSLPVEGDNNDSGIRNAENREPVDLTPLYEATDDEIIELTEAIGSLDSDYEAVLIYSKFLLSGKFDEKLRESTVMNAARYNAVVFCSRLMLSPNPDLNQLFRDLESVNWGGYKDAFMRDVARLAKRRGLNALSGFIAEREPLAEEMEDPFDLGDKFFDDLINVDDAFFIKDQRRLSKAMAPYREEGLDPTVQFDVKRLHASSNVAYDIISLINIDKDASHMVNYFNTFGDVLLAGLPSSFLFSYLEILVNRRGGISEIRGFFESVIKRFVHEHAVKRDNSNVKPLVMCWLRKDIVVGLLEKDRQFLSDYLTVVRNGEGLDLSIAITSIGEMIHGLSGEEKTGRLKGIVESLMVDTADWSDKRLAIELKVLAEVAGCGDELGRIVKEVYMERCDSVVFDFLESEDEEPVEDRVNDKIEELANACPLFEGADKQELAAAFREKITPQAADDSFFQKLRNADLPADFNPGVAAREIFNDTSLPLLEARKIDSFEVLSKKFKVVIEPNPACPSELTCFRIRIVFKNLKKGKLTLQELVLDFENGQLVTDVFLAYRAACEKLGLYFGHKYFVKERQEKVLPPNDDSDELTDEELELLTNPDVLHEDVEVFVDEDEDEEIEEGDTDGEDVDTDGADEDTGGADAMPEDEENGPDSEPRDYHGRTLAPLTIDIRDKDDEEMEEENVRLSRTLLENKELVKKLLNGEIDDVDFESVILHRITVQIRDKKRIKIYERVPADEILDAAVDGTLADKEWFLINNLPHMKALGYRKYVPKPADPASPPYWAVKRNAASGRARMAYDAYEKAGFPRLSGFHEFKAVMGIVADADYEQGEMLVEYGDVVKILKTTRRDMNAALARRITEKAVPEVGREPWLNKWIASQKAQYESEIDEIMESDLSDQEKLAEIELLERKIADLPELAQKMRDQTFLARQGTSHFVRLTLGWVPSETTFNQGTFISVRDLAAREESNESTN